MTSNGAVDKKETRPSLRAARPAWKMADSDAAPSVSMVKLGPCARRRESLSRASGEALRGLEAGAWACRSFETFRRTDRLRGKVRLAVQRQGRYRPWRPRRQRKREGQTSHGLIENLAPFIAVPGAAFAACAPYDACAQGRGLQLMLSSVSV